MFMIKLNYFLITFLICFFNVFGQENKAENEKEQPAKEVAEAPKPTPAPPAPPGPPWWTTSAMVSPNNKWQAHIEGELKYTYQTGTLDSHLIETNAMFALRKNRFTNFLSMDIAFMDANQHFAVYVPDSNGDLQRLDLTQKILLRKYQGVDVFRTDINKNLFWDIGWEGFRDDMSFIKTRNTFFSGIGYQFDVRQKHHFSFIAGGGYEDTEYTSREVLVTRGIPLTVVIDETPNSAAVFGQYKGSQQLSKTVSLHQSFFYTHYFEEDRKDRWELKLRVMFRANPRLFFFTAFEAIYENNEISNAAGGDKLNTKLVTGIKISF
jgi:hypothetical protein